MDSQRCTNVMKIIQFLFIAFIFNTFQSKSQAAQFSLETIGNLAKEIELPIAIAPIAKNGQQYIMATKAGYISRFNVSNRADVPITNIFHLKDVFPNLTVLTAFTLHPNFGQRDQKGYLTLYTAHTELASNNIHRNTLTEKNTDISSLDAEAVIIQWQLDENLDLDLASQREIIRIRTSTESTLINQLAFNANLKAWHEQFGELYIGLNKINKLQTKPLYSGAILRINPERFGLKNYTIPAKNPYKQNAKVANEILVYSLDELGKFLWSKKDENLLLVDHKINNQRTLSHVKLGTKITNQTIMSLPQNEALNNQMLYYHGKQLTGLFGNILFTTLINNRWQIQSLNPFNGANAETILFLDTKEQPVLFTDHQGEPLLFNKSKKQLVKLKDTARSGQQPKRTLKETNNFNINKLMFVLLIVGSILVIIFVALRKFLKRKTSAKRFFHQQYTHMEYSADKAVIHIFKHHQNTPEYSVHVKQIKQFKGFINEHELYSLDATQGMTQEIEAVIREAFNIEKREKMQPQMLRTVFVQFIDTSERVLPVYLYMRKGDHRLSRMKYDEVCQLVTDWYWQLSEKIAPKYTGARKVSTLPTAHIKPEINPSNPTKTHEKVSDTTLDLLHKEVPKTENKKSNNTNNNQALKDTEIIKALEKLAHLKKEGFLTDIEFEQAKAKLLKDLK